VPAMGASNGCFGPPTASCGKIGRAALDGTGVDQRFTPPFGSMGKPPCGLTQEPDHEYWTLGAPTNTIGQAHGPFVFNPNFITLTTGSDPCGIAFATGHLYWANRGLVAGNTTIGRAEI